MTNEGGGGRPDAPLLSAQINQCFPTSSANGHIPSSGRTPAPNSPKTGSTILCKLPVSGADADATTDAQEPSEWTHGRASTRQRLSV